MARIRSQSSDCGLQNSRNLSVYVFFRGRSRTGGNG